MITLTAFRSGVPPFAHGLVRDLRVRWALEEAGIAYREKLIDRDDLRSPEHLALQPFGQVPAIETPDVTLFESGAIVLYIAERSEALLPRDAAGRARATAWVCAALNSIEPTIQSLLEIDLNQEAPWAAPRRPAIVEKLGNLLTAVEERLSGRDYLEGRFTVGDLMMTTELRFLRHTDIVAKRPVLQAYQQRCEARPAFQKALADHLRPFANAA